MKTDFMQVSVMLFFLGIGLWVGYYCPRDVELESLKPVQFHYEITKEAARELILKSVDGCPTSPAD